MKKVLVLFGGVSSEHDISLISASSVIKNIPSDKYDIIKIGITKSGEWFLYNGSEDNLPGEKWLSDKNNLISAVISPDRKDHGIIIKKDSGFEVQHIDIVFPVLHGKNGEDGTIQGMLQLSGIPFVGCDMVSSACCMDKAVTNSLADANGIPQAKWLAVKINEYKKQPSAFLDKAGNYLSFPIFVKPANAGSSVGISKACSKDELSIAIDKAFKEDPKVVLEECIIGAEVECAVLGNDNPIASIPGQIVASSDFYDFDAKYVSGTSELHIPALIDDKKIAEVRAAAVNAYKALGCSGLSRVDFFVRKSDGKVMLNEPNTIPGFTSISMYPKMFAASGIEYSKLLDDLLTLAEEKWNQ